MIYAIKKQSCHKGHTQWLNCLAQGHDCEVTEMDWARFQPAAHWLQNQSLSQMQCFPLTRTIMLEWKNIKNFYMRSRSTKHKNSSRKILRGAMISVVVRTGAPWMSVPYFSPPFCTTDFRKETHFAIVTYIYIVKCFPDFVQLVNVPPELNLARTPLDMFKEAVDVLFFYTLSSVGKLICKAS